MRFSQSRRDRAFYGASVRLEPLTGKYFFYEFLNKKLHSKFNYLEKIFSKNELLVMVIFRFVGMVPFFIANLLPVIFNISIKNYYLGTLIGIFHTIFIMVSLGSGLSNIINTSNISIFLVIKPNVIFLYNIILIRFAFYIEV